MSTSSSASGQGPIWPRCCAAGARSPGRCARPGRPGSTCCPGAPAAGAWAGLGPPLLERLLDDLAGLARGYDVTLLDLPAGIDHAVRRLLRAATLRLVVTTEEPTALTDAYALIKVSRNDDASGALEVVVNLAANHEAGRRTHEGLQRVCAHFLGLSPPLAGVLRRDPRVVDAIRHQSPLLLRHPASPAARDVEALARRLQAAP